MPEISNLLEGLVSWLARMLASYDRSSQLLATGVLGARA